MSQILIPPESAREREVRIRFKNEFPFFAHNCLKIGHKEGGIIDFRVNKAQLYLHNIAEKQLAEKGFIKILCLKGRQQGISTYVEGRFFWKVIHNKGLHAFILTHRKDATDHIFQMAQKYYKYLPEHLKPYVERRNADEFLFAHLESGYKVGTASAGNVGRSNTIQLFHGSEVSHWECAQEIVSGVMQGITKRSEIFLETTARGIDNYFYQQWRLAELGETDFIPVFIPWHWQDEYAEELAPDFRLDDDEIEIRDLFGLNNNQMAFRRTKVKEMGINLFHQEYPFTPTEAFQASQIAGYIPSDAVIRAMKNTEAKEYGALIIGVDPARNEGGGDRTAIICRQGRVAFNLKSFKTNDTMHIVGIVHSMIKELNPAAVCIDVIGLGAGVVDRLKELGYSNIVKPVNCGTTAYDSDKYSNKKAEMWGLMKEWLMDTPCKIPDIDSLHTDLCSVKFKYTSNTQLIVLNDKLSIESKSSLKSRGVSSPDEAEALGLTFAFPMSANIEYKKSYSRAHSW